MRMRDVATAPTKVNKTHNYRTKISGALAKFVYVKEGGSEGKDKLTFAWFRALLAKFL